MANAIQVNKCQSGNPLMKKFTLCSCTFADIEPDFVVGRTACALFLSIRFHALHPKYIYERISRLGESYDLRILLVLVDHVELNTYLKELSQLCIRCNFTLMLCWTVEDAAMYLERYKLSEGKSADVIMEKPTNHDYEEALDQYMIDALTESRSINRTDAASIVYMFDNFSRISSAAPEELAICPGVGLNKAMRLYDLLHKPMKRGDRQQPRSSQRLEREHEVEINLEPVQAEASHDDGEKDETADQETTSDGQAE